MDNVIVMRLCYGFMNLIRGHCPATTRLRPASKLRSSAVIIPAATAKPAVEIVSPLVAPETRAVAARQVAAARASGPPTP
jgi:hypothetical protein